MVGFKLQLHLTSEARRLLERFVQLVVFDGGYIGACIVEDGLVPLGWVMKRDVLKRIGSDWAAQRTYFEAQSQLLAELLRGAEPAWEKPVAVAQIPYGFLRRDPIGPSVFPLGDQLAVIPSLTGDGMAIALFTGISAAQSVLAGRSGEDFQRQTVKRLKGQFRWAGAVNTLFETKALHAVGLSIARTWP